MKEINVGIDLGTTYSAVSVFDETAGKAVTLKNLLDEETTPSVVYIKDGVVEIGKEAKDLQASGDTNVVAFYKSRMGSSDFSVFLDGKEYDAQALSGLFLKKLKKSVEQANGVKIKGAVITVPAYFNEAQRQATIKAGQVAGLNVLKIINEPTSAIIAYGLTGQGDKTVMVYDLGGGTFDVTIAKISGSNVKVIATNGDHQLGGRDWDKVIIDELVKRFLNEFGEDITVHKEEYNELIVKGEWAKKMLTSLSSVQVPVMCEGYTGKYAITREFFESATADLMEQTLMLTELCFDEIGGGFGWHSLDEVVLVGGSTRMPQVSKAITEKLGKPPKIIGNLVDTIVATGAAMQAQLCASGTITITPINASRTNGAPAMLTINGDDIKDVTSHSLGMLAFSESGKIVNSIIIKKNSETGVPYGKNYTFRGDKLEVYVVQGEFTEPEECTLLYKYEVTGMTRGADNKFTINFLYNTNGVVEVSGKLFDGRQLAVSKSVINESMEKLLARLMREKEEAKRRRITKITFIIDTSGSMSGDRLSEAKRSVKEFARSIDLNNAKVSVMKFDDDSRYICVESNDFRKIENSADALRIEGGTDGDPLEYYYNTRKATGEPEILVVLTDGEWFRQSDAIVSASRLKDKGVKIYAVGIGEADEKFLKKIASDGGAQKIDLSKLVTTFKDIAGAIATEYNDYNSIK